MEDEIVARVPIQTSIAIRQPKQAAGRGCKRST